MKKIVLFILLSTAGCASKPDTLLPIVAYSQVASFDGNDHDSGIKSFVPGVGFELSESAAQRYLDLSNKFREKPIPIIRQDSKSFLNKEGMVHFLVLNDRNSTK